MWRPSKAAAALVLCLAAAAPMGSASAQGGGQAIKVVNFDYEPVNVTVDVNTTVTWTNASDRPHTVTDRGGTFDSNQIQPGRTAQVSFTVPGTYHYFCRVNPTKMNGIIVVKPGTTAARTSRVEAIDPTQLAGESLRFVPNTLSVEAGSSVLFANVGGKPHTLTADDGSFDTGIVPPGAEGGRFAGANATFTVNKPGIFTFHCEIHPAVMRGTLTVTGTAREGPAPPSAAANTASVDMVDFAFKPPEASVAPGGKVTWKNTGQARHTATFDDVPGLDTNVIAPGGQAELTAPTKPGSYSYRCNIHPAKMRGVLVVVGQNTNDPTKKVAAAPAAYTAGKAGPGGGVSTLALVCVALGAFLGGFGIAAFIRRPAAAQ